MEKSKESTYHQSMEFSTQSSDLNIPDEILFNSGNQKLMFDLDQVEYGFNVKAKTNLLFDIHFHPREYGILESYCPVKNIYSLLLSPTIVTLTNHIKTN